MTEAEIIARLEKLTGPDREVDGDIAQRLAQAPLGSVRMWGMSAYGERFATGAYTHWEAPAYTASIDAAVALVERVLPGWNWRVDSDKSAAVYVDNGYYEQAATPAIALLIALFRARALAQGE